jgi:hypothetical protein
MEVLKIANERMDKDGHLFFCSANGVGLSESVRCIVSSTAGLTKILPFTLSVYSTRSI